MGFWYDGIRRSCGPRVLPGLWGKIDIVQYGQNATLNHNRCPVPEGPLSGEIVAKKMYRQNARL